MKMRNGRKLSLIPVFLHAIVATITALVLGLNPAIVNAISIMPETSGEFADISSIGAALNLSDDGEINVTSEYGNEAFPPGPVRVGNNGGMVFGAAAGDIGFTNQPLPSSSLPSGAALLPFWDDLDSDTGNVYFLNFANMFIVQWHDRPHFPGPGPGGITFQVQVYSGASGCPGDPYARMIYQDVIFGDAGLDNGASATIGFQTSLTDYFEYSHNQPGAVVDGTILAVYKSGPDSDGDGVPDSCDACPDDPSKILPGICGCGVGDEDDGGEVPYCFDGCPEDPNKSGPGVCGCGAADVDSDGDSVPDCFDQCPADPAKVIRGVCECGVAETDANRNGIIDCLVGDELRHLISRGSKALKRLKASFPRSTAAEVRKTGTLISALVASAGPGIEVNDVSVNVSELAKNVRTAMQRAARSKSGELAKNKKKALTALKALLGILV